MLPAGLNFVLASLVIERFFSVVFLRTVESINAKE